MNNYQNTVKKIGHLLMIPVFLIAGCLPLFSTTLTDKIDLGLSITVDNPHPKIGDKVTFTISVENKGTIDATGVGVKSLIPSGQGNATCISLNGQRQDNAMVWENLSIAKGTKLSFVYHAEILARGDYNTITEITEAHQEDIDSTPNNGADNDHDGLVGSYDMDDSFDDDDEDDGDDAIISVTSNTVDTEFGAELTQVAVYPNPASSQVNIDVFNPSQAEVNVMMYTQVGQLINKKSEVKNNSAAFKEVVEVSSLKPGRYLFNVIIGETSYIKTVIIGR